MASLLSEKKAIGFQVEIFHVKKDGGMSSLLVNG
jgi:hypothetical protein